MNRSLNCLHPIFRCIDSAIFFDFVDYVMNNFNRELFDYSPDEQLYLFSRFRLIYEIDVL